MGGNLTLESVNEKENFMLTLTIISRDTFCISVVFKPVEFKFFGADFSHFGE